MWGDFILEQTVSFQNTNERDTVAAMLGCLPHEERTYWKRSLLWKACSFCSFHVAICSSFCSVQLIGMMAWYGASVVLRAIHYTA